MEQQIPLDLRQTSVSFAICSSVKVLMIFVGDFGIDITAIGFDLRYSSRVAHEKNAFRVRM